MTTKMVKRDEYLPVTNDLLQGGMPLELPDLPFDKDPISKAFHNLALRQIAKSEALKADISESRNRQAQNYLETINRAMLFGDNIYEAKQQIKDSQELRRTEIEIRKEQLEQEKVKTYTMKLEAKDLEMTFNYKVKEMKKQEDEVE